MVLETHLFFFLVVEPTMDLSAFKDGLEIIVPNPIKILVPSTGYPRPTATWSFGDQVLEAGDRVKMKTISAYAELVISPSERPDKGIYTLKLENPVKSISGEIDVNVIGKELKTSFVSISKFVFKPSMILTFTAFLF
jgi:titin